MNRDGHIFVKSNASLRNRVKIEGSREDTASSFASKRDRHPEILEAFKTDFRHYFEDIVEAQKRVYSSLSEYRLLPGRPFFSCGVPYAKTVVLSVAEDKLAHGSSQGKADLQASPEWPSGEEPSS